jgi:hypothetical protein
MFLPTETAGAAARRHHRIQRQEKPDRTRWIGSTFPRFFVAAQIDIIGGDMPSNVIGFPKSIKDNGFDFEFTKDYEALALDSLTHIKTKLRFDFNSGELFIRKKDYAPELITDETGNVIGVSMAEAMPFPESLQLAEAIHMGVCTNEEGYFNFPYLTCPDKYLAACMDSALALGIAPDDFVWVLGDLYFRACFDTKLPPTRAVFLRFKRSG